ncbi:expressed unknown protein [Seminavis robusta]|uniref:Potassium channel tetramerisation-type BTB domain-containing protein n=1 Tax=Seminavis robusta TaxID=568900 RepID=A0A9N8E707_9STRA|nr:expressed unknown protein [Seminavis robusta]|eukprot:Sro744_g196280.1 n/a (256) ;mRNA; r:47105-47872
MLILPHYYSKVLSLSHGFLRFISYYLFLQATTEDGAGPEQADQGRFDSSHETQSPLIDLSVSGTLFTIRRDLLAENKGILSNIDEPDKGPHGIHHEGRYFIDGDPIAFRWILHYLRYQSLPSPITQSLTELECIQQLADCLCFEPLLAYLNGCIEQCNQAKTRMEELEEEIERLKRDHAEELEGLKSLHENVNAVDGIRFLSHKTNNVACKLADMDSQRPGDESIQDSMPQLWRWGGQASLRENLLGNEQKSHGR